MAKWKCLFGWVKRLFTSDSKENKESQKPKNWGWSLGRLRLKQHSTTTATSRTLIEAKTMQRKHALAMAVATKAAAEAAVAAAHAAAEVVRLTSASRSYSYPYKEEQVLAAIKIQSAYRAHLARKALRALKGVVRLQAIVRGQAARREVSSTFKKLPSNARKQAEIQEGSSHSEGESCKTDKIRQFTMHKKKLEEKVLKTECSGQRTWDCSLHSIEDIEAIWLRKQEAIAKRERMKKYSCSHRGISIRQMVEETCDRDVFPKSALPSNLITKELHGTTQVVARRNLKKEDLQDQGTRSQISIRRKSFSHVKRSPVVDESSMPNSPVFPAYMALIESSKAKARSLSTPRERTRLLDFCYNNQSAPQKEGTSIWYYHDATSNTNVDSEASQQRCESANSLCYN